MTMAFFNNDLFSKHPSFPQNNNIVDNDWARARGVHSSHDNIFKLFLTMLLI
jgi:hypothetical protein